MAKTIWKYDFETTDEQTIEMPSGGEILSVQTQADSPKMWVLLDPTNPKEKRRFRIFGTGHPISGDTSSLHFIGTYQLRSGSLVFHIFEDRSFA